MITFIILLVIIFVLFITAKSVSHKEEPQQPSRQQPARFDLLDDNGDPIPEQPEATEPVVRKLLYFCIKDKGYHVTVWPKGQKIPDYLEFDIAGMSFRGNLDNYIGEHAGTLESEPTNEYDANAIKILAEDGHHVGYVPKDMTGAVRDFATLPCACYFYIGNNDGTYYSDAYIKKNDSDFSPYKN